METGGCTSFDSAASRGTNTIQSFELARAFVAMDDDFMFNLVHMLALLAEFYPSVSKRRKFVAIYCCHNHFLQMKLQQCRDWYKMRILIIV